MRLYRKNAASPIRIDYGIALVLGLAHFPETAGYSSSMKKVNDELDDAYKARVALRKPLVEARTIMRFAQYTTDQLIRQISKATEIADGGRRGPISEGLFPDGLGPVVAPTGRRQIKPTEDLLDRMIRSRLPGMDTFRAEWQPKLESTLTSFKNKADTYQGASDAYVDAFRAELALRHEHFFTVDKMMGLVRAAFPRDKTRQDLVFPDMGSDARVVLEEDEDEPDDEGPSE